MPVSIPTEITFFLYSMLYGAAFFCVYDVLRCVRRIIIHNVFWIAVEDLLFWMAAGILLFLMIFDKNSGSLRGFFFLGLAAGALAWYFLFDHFLMAGLTGVLVFLKKAAGKAWGICKEPAVFLAKRFVWTLHFLGKKMKKIGRSFRKSLKKGARIVKIGSNKTAEKKP